jgi:hypothetical protein
MSTSTLEQSPIALALHRSPLPPLRKLTLEETEEAVIIHGKVSSYYLKQVAQETIMPLIAGRKLVNRTVVVREVTPQS